MRDWSREKGKWKQREGDIVIVKEQEVKDPGDGDSMGKEFAAQS